MSAKGGEGSIRAFIAVDLPPSLKEALGGLQDALKGAGAKARWVRPEGVHLTLKFLGYIQPDKVPAVRSAMEEAVRGTEAFEARVAGVGAFPNARRPRVIWVGLEEPTGALLSVQKRLESALVPLGFEPEKRPFKAHLTLARIKQPGRSAGVAEALEAQKGVDLGKISVEKLVLYKSTLKPTGAVYTPLEEVALGGA